jgi:hypothetical protein
MLFFSRKTEGYSNYNLEGAAGNYPSAENEVLVQDFYPRINSNGISNNTASDIWWHYPVFQLGSYKQITNNIKYSNNPDEGTCMPASICGALYHEKQEKTNYVTPLPPVNPECGTRVGYFSTDENLLPYRTDMQNILY